jgi:hypothetical protein
MGVEELEEQVCGYNTLKIYQTHRGISAIMLITSAALTLLMIVIEMVDYLSVVDIAISLILAGLLFKKYRWAIICAMLFWTLEKALKLKSAYAVTSIFGGFYLKYSFTKL